MTILGASFDTVEENAKFAAAQRFPYPLLCDVDKKMGIAYGAADDVSAAVPRRTTVVVGPDGRVERVDPKVDPRSHPQELLEALRVASAAR